MPRGLTPLAKAEASGATAKNPQRYRGRKEVKHKRPLGEPYVTMTDAQKAAWHDIAGDAPWLHSSHRTLLRLACYHAAKLHSGEDLGISATSVLASLLAKLGLTPVDEAKVNHGDDGDEDPSDKFFGPRKSQ